MIESAPTN